MARYRCTSTDCGWTGLIDVREGPLPPARRAWVARALRGLVPLGMAAAAVAVASWGAARAPVANVGVGARLFAPGEAFDGESLPADHPLLLAGMTQLYSSTGPASEVAPADEVQGRTDAAGAGLALRRFCAWGRPGRMPYRGTMDEALRAAQMPAAMRQQIVAAAAAGRAADRLTIGNDGIRAVSSAREFEPRSFAMTYGRTLCLGVRVNFKPGHVEPATLFEAQDPTSGRLYSVMVPDVCGNVSVLKRRPGSGTATQRADAGEPWDPGDIGTRVTHTAMTDKPNEIPAPGTLALTLLALAAAAAVRRRGR